MGGLDWNTALSKKICIMICISDEINLGKHKNDEQTSTERDYTRIMFLSILFEDLSGDSVFLGS